MMLKNNYTEKIKQLRNLKKGVSLDEQIEIDFTIFGMQWAFGEENDSDEGKQLHEKRMDLLYSNNPEDKRKGEAYRKGMDIVLYSVRGKKREPATAILPSLRVEQSIEKGLNNIKDYLKIKTTATIRKAALRWYIDAMSEKSGKDFLNGR
jgi:hypothetical protein